MNIKKIYFFLLIFLILGLTGCVQGLNCGCISCQIKSGENIKIFIAADPHHMSKKIYDNGKAFQDFINTGDCKLLKHSDEIIDGFIQDIEKYKPDIVIIPGDLTANGELESHIEFAKKLKTIQKSGACVFVIPGNHDIENPWAKKYIGGEAIEIDSITSDEFVDIYGPYGYSNALTRDEDSLSYLTTPSEDLWLLMLDSSKYKNNKKRNCPEMGGQLSYKTLKWIEQCSDLSKENNAKLIAVMHHSLIDHNEIITEDYTIENNMKIIKTFQNCDIEIALTGHIHLQDIKSYNSNNKIIYDIATSCLIGYPNQYGVLDFMPDKGYQYNTQPINMVENPKKFENCSKNFFQSQNFNKYYNSLLKSDQYSQKEIEAIAETVSRLNLKYFAGFRNSELEEFKDTEGFELLQGSQPNHIKDYVMSMFNDERTDNNKLFIPIN